MLVHPDPASNRLMSLHHRALTAVVALSALAAASAPARAQPIIVHPPTPAILDFEPLSTADGCDKNGFTSYGGLAWTGWGAISKLECGSADIGGPQNGYWYGATSGHKSGYLQLPRFAVDPFQALVGSITNADGFDLLDAWMTAAWNNGLIVHVDAFRGHTLVGMTDFVVDYGGPSHISFNFINITSATFTASGGTPDYNLGGVGSQLVMDDANVAIYPHVVVPEPATIGLVAIGLLALTAVVRRRAVQREANTVVVPFRSNSSTA